MRSEFPTKPILTERCDDDCIWWELTMPDGSRFSVPQRKETSLREIVHTIAKFLQIKNYTILGFVDVTGESVEYTVELDANDPEIAKVVAILRIQDPNQSYTIVAIPSTTLAGKQVPLQITRYSKRSGFTATTNLLVGAGLFWEWRAEIGSSTVVG